MGTRMGVVVASVSEDRRRGVLVELGCATEICAAKPEFIAFAHNVANKIMTLRPRTEVDEACRAVRKKLGETIRVRRCQIISVEPLESVAAADGKGIAVVIAGSGAERALLDLAANAIVERKTNRAWRSEFAAVPPHLDWIKATVLLAARKDPQLSELLPRDEAGAIQIDADAMQELQRAFASRAELTRCVMYDLIEDDRDPEPFDHADAIRVRSAG